MIQCLGCGNRYPQGTKYCNGCGRVVDILITKGIIKKSKMSDEQLEELASKKNKTNEEYLELSKWYGVSIEEIVKLGMIETQIREKLDLIDRVRKDMSPKKEILTGDEIYGLIIGVVVFIIIGSMISI